MFDERGELGRDLLVVCVELGDLCPVVVRQLEPERGRLVKGKAPAAVAALRGIDALSAVGLCAEVGDFARFARAGSLMSDIGLIPSEDTSGEKRQQCATTKTGSRHARRWLVEGACHNRRAPAHARRCAAAKTDSPPRSSRSPGRPNHGYTTCGNDWTPKRGKRRTIIAFAVARQLAGLCWTLANAD